MTAPVKIDTRSEIARAMNPSTPSPRGSSNASRLPLSPALPANFHDWPKTMRDRFRRHALAGG